MKVVARRRDGGGRLHDIILFRFFFYFVILLSVYCFRYDTLTLLIGECVDNFIGIIKWGMPRKIDNALSQLNLKKLVGKALSSSPICRMEFRPGIQGPPTKIAMFKNRISLPNKSYTLFEPRNLLDIYLITVFL